MVRRRYNAGVGGSGGRVVASIPVVKRRASSVYARIMRASMTTLRADINRRPKWNLRHQLSRRASRH